MAIGASPLSAIGLALNHLQRQAIRNDPLWRDGDYPPGNQPVAGLGPGAGARGLLVQVAGTTSKSALRADLTVVVKTLLRR